MSTATDTLRNVTNAELLTCVPRLRAYAGRLTRDGDRADDLVQDTIVKALTAAHQFRVGTSLMSWTMTILRNQFYSDLRRRRTEPLDEGVEVSSEAHPNRELGLELLDFRRAFWQLGDSGRRALILVGAAGLSYAEAAIVCDCRVGTAKSRVHRARQDLKRILRDGRLGAVGVSTSAMADYMRGVFDSIASIRPEPPRAESM